MCEAGGCAVTAYPALRRRYSGCDGRGLVSPGRDGGSLSVLRAGVRAYPAVGRSRRRENHRAEMWLFGEALTRG